MVVVQFEAFGRKRQFVHVYTQCKHGKNRQTQEPMQHNGDRGISCMTQLWCWLRMCFLSFRLDFQRGLFGIFMPYWQLRVLKCRSQPMQKDAILLKYSVNFFESKLTTLSPGKLMSAMTIGLYLPVFFEILLSKMACSQRIYCLNSYYIYSKSAIKSHHVTGMRPF